MTSSGKQVDVQFREKWTGHLRLQAPVAQDNFAAASTLASDSGQFLYALRKAGRPKEP
jgi:hypothetical protein